MVKALWNGQISAWLGAFCLILSNLILILTYSGSTIGKYPDPKINDGFNADSLFKAWEWRRKAFRSFLAIEFFMGFGLLLLMHSVFYLKRICKNYEGNAPKIMFYCFVLGGILPIVEFLQNLGSTMTADLISTIPNLTEQQIIALEISWLVSQSNARWVFSMLYVFNAFGLIISSYITFSTGNMTKFHGVLGILTAIAGLLVFIMDVASILNEKLSIVYATFALFWGCILLPLWMISLGFVLRREAPRRGNNYEMEDSFSVG